MPICFTARFNAFSRSLPCFFESATRFLRRLAYAAGSGVVPERNPCSLSAKPPVCHLLVPVSGYPSQNLARVVAWCVISPYSPSNSSLKKTPNGFVARRFWASRTSSPSIIGVVKRSDLISPSRWRGASGSHGELLGQLLVALRAAVIHGTPS
jgi:hypothetical protein